MQLSQSRAFVSSRTSSLWSVVCGLWSVVCGEITIGVHYIVETRESGQTWRGDPRYALHMEAHPTVRAQDKTVGCHPRPCQPLLRTRKQMD